MFVASLGDVGDRVQILADELAQDACARSMKDAHAAHAYQDGIVDEMHHSVNSLVASHATHVQVLMEVLLSVFHRRACYLRSLNGQMGVLVSGISRFSFLITLL